MKGGKLMENSIDYLDYWRDRYTQESQERMKLEKEVESLKESLKERTEASEEYHDHTDLEIKNRDREIEYFKKIINEKTREIAQLKLTLKNIDDLNKENIRLVNDYLNKSE